MKLRLKSRLTKPNLITGALVVSGLSLFMYKLGSLLPGLAKPEIQLPTVRQSLDAVWNVGTHLPYTLSELAVAAALPTGGYSASRLPAVLLGITTLVLMFRLLNQWYGQRLAIFGVLLMMTSPWFLHVARLATPDISYVFAMTFILVLLGAWHKKDRGRLLIYASAIGGALVLTLTGTIWLVLCLIVFERKNIWTSLTTNKLHAFLASLLGLALLAPLIRQLVDDYSQYKSVLGWFGGHDALISYPKEFVTVWQNIFLGGYTDPVYNLGGLPLVSILMTLAVAVGIYLYSQHPKASRTRSLLALWIIATALVSLPGQITNAVLLPIVIVLATGGIGYLLHLWLKVFPRNPIARGFGIGLIALLVTFGIAYNLRNYYVAWPNTPATEQAFSRQL